MTEARQKLLEVLQPWFHDEYGFCSSASPSKDTVCYCVFIFVCNRICPSVNGFAIMLQNKKISVTTNKVKNRRALQTHSSSELLSNLVLFFLQTTLSTNQTINPAQLQMLLWMLINNIPERANTRCIMGLLKKKKAANGGLEDMACRQQCSLQK